MRTLVYSRELLAGLPEGEFRNPRMFLAAEADVDTVFVGPEWPRIAEAYVAAGADVRPLQTTAAPASVLGVEQAPISIPADWEELPFSAPAGEVSQKSLALALEPEAQVRSKADAAVVINAAIGRTE